MILTSILMITDENCSDLHLLLWSFLSLSLFFINIFTLNILRRTSTWQRTSSQSCGGSSVLLSASSTAPRYEEPLDLEQLNVQIFQHQWMPEEVEETWMHAVETFFLKKVLEYQVDHLLGGWDELRGFRLFLRSSPTLCWSKQQWCGRFCYVFLFLFLPHFVRAFSHLGRKCRVG